MNIFYSQPITEDDVFLFKLIDDFIIYYLNDKKIYDQITIHLYIYNDKKDALHIHSSVHMYPNSYNFQIKINGYFCHITSESCKRNNGIYNTDFLAKCQVVFHELGHIVYQLNHPEYLKMLCKHEEDAKNRGVKLFITVNEKEEKSCNEMALEFIKLKCLGRKENQ